MKPGSPISGAAVRAARSALTAVLSLLLLLPAPGCVSKHTFRPEAFDEASDDDIRVYLKERRMVEFDGGDYRSIDSAGARYLVGSGIDTRPDSAEVKVPFSGAIPYAAIDRIETRKVDYIAALYVTAFFAFFAIFGFTTDLTN